MVILKESIATEEDIFLFSSIKKEFEQQMLTEAMGAIEEADTAEREYYDSIYMGEYDDCLIDDYPEPYYSEDEYEYNGVDYREV